MKESKFSLADVLTLIGAIIFGFIMFISYNFLTNGDQNGSIKMALIWTGVIAILAIAAKILKGTNNKFERRIWFEWACLISFFIIAGLSINKFSHAITVYSNKSKIQSDIDYNISEVENLFTSYESYVEKRKDDYLSDLKLAKDNKIVDSATYHRFGFVDERPAAEQISNFMFMLDAELIPSNYEGQNGIKNVSNKWLQEARATTQNTWAFAFGIMDVIEHLDKNANKWRRDFIELSEMRMDNETAVDFVYDFDFKDVSKDVLSKQSKATIFGVIISLLLFFLMLLPYLITKRSNKSDVTLFKPTLKKEIDESEEDDINIKM